MEILFTFVFLLALLTFGGLCMARALFPCSGVTLVVSAQGDGGDLQQKIYALMWLRGLGLLSCPIYLVDQGLTPQGDLLANLLMERWPHISMWQGEDFFHSPQE